MIIDDNRIGSSPGPASRAGRIMMLIMEIYARLFLGALCLFILVALFLPSQKSAEEDNKGTIGSSSVEYAYDTNLMKEKESVSVAVAEEAYETDYDDEYYVGIDDYAVDDYEYQYVCDDSSSEGYNSGYSAGYDDGYDDGYWDGYDAGREGLADELKYEDSYPDDRTYIWGY